MASIFSTVPLGKPKTNTFNLSHQRKTTMQAGKLVPVLCEEVLPGDRWKCRSDILTRMDPMLAPIYHDLKVYIHYFFVPNRLVWNEWQDFITGGEDGLANPSFPRIGLRGDRWLNYAGVGSLADHMGVQSALDNGSADDNFTISALPFRAYQLIWNEYYRDQNLQDPIQFDKGSGTVADGGILLEMRQRAWQKDYFTSAQPWTQRGPEAVIPVSGQGTTPERSVEFRNTAEQTYQKFNGGTWNAGQHNAEWDSNRDAAVLPLHANDGTADTAINMNPNGTLYVDGTNVEVNGIGIPVNDLRASVALQSWLERNQRGGGRYFEQILSHFHVSSPDKRLQRPEFLGGGSTPIAISEVLQTSANANDESPLATFAGHGISANRSNQFSYFAQEHGFIIGIVSVLPRTAYQQGLRRFFRKFDRFDYAFPEFSHLGEQELYNWELYVNLSTGGDNLFTFGYQSRYAEYKYIPDTTHGDFRDTRKYWHMARDFASRPHLNAEFVAANPTNRIFAVEQGDHYLMLVNNHCFVNRRLPKYGVPRLIG